MEYAINIKRGLFSNFGKEGWSIGLSYVMVLWFLSIRTYLYLTIRDIQYNCEGYMALALAQYEDLF